MIWRMRTESLSGGDGIRVTPCADQTPVTYRDVCRSWQNDESFRRVFIDSLSGAPYGAYFWETPPVTRDTLERPFEFVLIPAPGLERVPTDTQAFAEHFRGGDRDVVRFTNLGGDAELVVPTPKADPRCYPHLAAFARRAPLDQQHALWQAVGEAVMQGLSDKPLWLSTSGLGVYWVHIRLDSRPKYYNHDPYRRLSPSGVSPTESPLKRLPQERSGVAL